MSDITARIKRDLPLRISLMIVLALSLLLTTALLIMLFVSRKALKENAMKRASTTLEQANTNIDNILLSVEETAGNMFFNMRFDDPERMYTYARQIIETNPYVTGCAIAFQPGFYKDQPLFMAYEHYKGGNHSDHADTAIVRSETFGGKPYTGQIWFTRPMKEGYPMWLNPLAGMDSDIEPMTSFCLPIPGMDGKPVGVIGVDVSLRLLSDVVASARPSATSYCVLLDSDGSFIVHPLGDLPNYTALSVKGESVQDAVKTMMSGATGYMPVEYKGQNYHLFYKPFEQADVPNRSMKKWGWKIGLIYSEEDIFGGYHRLFNDVLVIAILGMLFMFLHTWLILRHRLKPLQMLTERTERIAQGHYDEPIPDSRQVDEIGSLQRNFQRMQQSVAANVGELHELTEAMEERSKELDKAYQRAQKADNTRTVFLHNMTNQMVAPALAIDESVTALTNYEKGDNPKSVNQMVDDILQHGHTITQLLNNLINLSDNKKDEEEGGTSC